MTLLLQCAIIADVIKGFACKETKKIHERKRSAKLPPNLLNVMQRKLQMLEAATTLDDLRIPTNNRLEALNGDRVGQYSIRINQQLRVCFTWKGSDAEHVEIVDYH